MKLLLVAAMVMTPTATVASNTEADTIRGIYNGWMINLQNEQARDEHTKAAAMLWEDTTPGSDCQQFADMVFTSMFIFDLSLDSGTPLGIGSVEFMQGQMDIADYNCAIGL